ncbi:MAG: NAD(P)H-dependent oxidoreductase [Nitrosopumilaceae archaeon]|nr:NAD(P)H-dependent oxidoreductase [Nitrososphaeria archaeon]NDF34614.1 NAD(P)H-dependent oxidoreductase [Nitrosopumilaceae archaeon]
MKVVVISGSPRKQAVTQTMMKFVYDYTKSKNPETKFINLSDDIVECYKGYDVTYSATTTQAAKDIMDADVWLVGTPIYNSFFSAALKNLFEFVNYKQTAGKTAGMAILASGQIGFTDVQTLLTQLMSYFRVITNPKAVFMTADQIKDGVIDQNGQTRLKEMVDETLLLGSRQH